METEENRHLAALEEWIQNRLEEMRRKQDDLDPQDNPKTHHGCEMYCSALMDVLGVLEAKRVRDRWAGVEMPSLKQEGWPWDE